MDLVLMGANVLTMDALNRRAEAVAVQGGCIAAVGANAEIAKQVGVETAVLHLAGRTLVPGFIDPHNHFSPTAFEPVSVDCRVPPHRSISSILDAIAATAKDTPRGRWIRGWGVQCPLGAGESQDHARGARRGGPAQPCLPSGLLVPRLLRELGRPRPGRCRPPHPGPAARADPSRRCRGTRWRLLGARDGSDPHGLAGPLPRVLQGDSRGADPPQRPAPSRVWSDQCRRCPGHPGVEKMYRLAESRKLLPLTVHQMLGGEEFYAPPEKVVTGASGDGNVADRLRGGTVKLFMDPVYPGFALIRYHACGHEERLGDCCYTQDEVDRLVMQAHQRGLQVAIHCCGTCAVEQALNAFERALRARPREAARFRMGHCVLPTIPQIKRARALGVVAVVQPSFIHRSGDRFEARAKEMGGDVRALPFKTMLGEGMIVAASSDSPGCPVDPMMGLYAMVTRRTQSGGPPAGAEEAVTPLEGLRMYSIDAAYAMGRDGEVGSLEPGKRADMVVLSHDPTAVDPAFLRDIVTERTYVEGQLLYQR